ncbi:hypothetical protein C6502_05645 [Candidatus Poribacteria bacterium]|nr:MAG: hypothetical protein C6502_05645 [Candidatus Poribacteria bacterium]
MKKRAATITTLLLITAIAKSHAQLYEHPFNLHQLKMGQGCIAAGAEYVNERVAAVASLEFGVLPTIEGFLKGGQIYFDDDHSPTLSPMSFFHSGLSSIQSLTRSDWKCLASASFFGSSANERTGVENSTVGFSVGFGFFNKIVGDSSLTIAPYALAFYDMSWWTLGEETSRGGAFSGQIGLEVGLSPNMSLLGSIISPLKSDRDTLFGIFLSFHPSATRSDIAQAARY